MVGCGCVCVCWRGSLVRNSLGSEGGAAIGAGLRHVPSLTTLSYVRWAEDMGGDDACVCVCWGLVCCGSGCVVGGGGAGSVEYESHVCDVMSCDVM